MSENCLEIKRIVKLYAFSILAPKFLDLSFSQKFKPSSPVPPYYSSSIMEYALRVTLGFARAQLVMQDASRSQPAIGIFILKKSIFYQIFDQIFGIPTLYPTLSNILPFDLKLRPSDAKYFLICLKINQKSNELSNFKHC